MTFREQVSCILCGNELHLPHFIVFTSQDSKIKTTSTYFVQKDETKVIQTAANKNDETRASLQSNKSNSGIQHFTKIMKQNGASPGNEKANEARITSLRVAHGYPIPSGNNNIVNDLKASELVGRNGKKKHSFVNGHKCDGLANNNDVTITEDDDLIPPTPSPVGQHSVMNCHAKLRSSSASTCKATVAKICKQLSATNYYNSEQRKTEEVEMGSTMLQRCDPAVTDTDKEESFVSGLVSPSCSSLGAQSTTCSTSRKKYKLFRKGKLPRVLSSPLKAKHICISPAKSPKNEKHAAKGTRVADQKAPTPVIAPSKCVVLRSRMKRSAAKGSSPLQKRMLTELPLPAKVLLGFNTYCNFFSLGLKMSCGVPDWIQASGLFIIWAKQEIAVVNNKNTNLKPKAAWIMCTKGIHSRVLIGTLAQYT